MSHLDRGADRVGVTLRLFLAVIAGALAVSVLVGASKTASAGNNVCGADVAGNGGYTYAGHQATRRGHGVRATITAVRAPEVAAGHVAGWIGLGGPGQGPNGEDMWIQVGLASMQGLGTLLYAEITRAGRNPQLILIEEDVPVGESRSLAILEMSRRPERWRIWVDGEPVTKPVHLPGSAERWAPIATAESWNGGQVACNRFAFRFERVSVSHGRGGSWFAFRPGYHFRDGDYQLRQLASASPDGQFARRLTDGVERPQPYAFVAASN
jgi:hypothetical protein